MTATPPKGSFRATVKPLVWRGWTVVVPGHHGPFIAHYTAASVHSVRGRAFFNYRHQARWFAKELKGHVTSKPRVVRAKALLEIEAEP